MMQGVGEEGILSKQDAQCQKLVNKTRIICEQ